MTGTPEGVPANPVDEGRALTRVNLWRIFVISAVVAGIASRAPDASAGTWTRVGLIALCCVLVYRGYRWALTLLGLLTALAAGLMVILAVASPTMHWTDRVMFGVSGAIQVAAFIILVKAPQVRLFMAEQRGSPQ